MNESALDTKFREALEKADRMIQAELPQDVQLRLYAYFKRATSASPGRPNTSVDLRNAFKTNAWMQVSHLSIDEAKQAYIDMIDSLGEK